jgi:hypothetical protein
MVERARLCFGCSALALLLCTCEIGAPLVDQRPEPSSIGTVLCVLTPSCTPREGTPDPALPLSAGAAIMIACADPSVCPPEPNMGDDADAGVGACPHSVAEDLPVQAACAELELQPAPGAGDIALSAAQWSNFNLTITTKTNIQVTLSEPGLSGVFVQLNGPVALHIAHAHSLHDVRISGTSTADGRPSLGFEDVEAEVLSVGDGAASFGGSVRAHATKLVDLSLRADDVTLESVWIEHGLLNCKELNLTDGYMKDVTLDAETAVLSASSFDDSRLHFCDDASVIECQLFQSGIALCAGTTARLYSGSVIEGGLDGSFEVDGSSLSAVRIGAEAATNIVGFNSSFTSVMLCSNVDLFALGTRSNITCSDCDHSFDTKNPACILPDPPSATTPNVCSTWPTDTPWQACPDDVPARTRPRP